MRHPIDIHPQIVKGLATVASELQGALTGDDALDYVAILRRLADRLEEQARNSK